MDFSRDFSITLSAMSIGERKAIKDELDRVERELAAKISIRIASQSQSTNHMSKVVGKNPVASLDIQYSVFFLWETKKSLQSKLSFPISTYCQLVNKSIKTSRRIVQCERLETRLKKNHPELLQSIEP